MYEVVAQTIADNYSLIHRVVHEVVKKESDLEIVAEACDGHEPEVTAALTNVATFRISTGATDMTSPTSRRCIVCGSIPQSSGRGSATLNAA